MVESKILITGGSGFIGTNLIEFLRGKNVKLLNLDVHQPLCSKHVSYWKKQDILNFSTLMKLFQEFRPQCVIHLAARTDCDENTTVEKDYRVNTVGTENVIAAIKATPSVSRVVITSTQYVCRPGLLPENDEY